MVATGMIYSTWVIVSLVVGAISAGGLLDTMRDIEHAALIDLLLLFVGFGGSIVLAVTSGNLDFIAGDGSTTTYTGMWYFVYVWYGVALLDIVFAVVTLSSMFKQFKYRRGYV